MVEKIYKQFEKKREKILKQPEEREFTPEKEKEILKETVSEEIQKTQAVPKSQQKTVKQSTQQIKSQPQKRQVKLLTDLAFEKGIPHAVEVAKRLESPYLLDEFHDALVDELYNKLVQEGRLKAI